MQFRAILLTMLAAALVAVGGFANVAAQEAMPVAEDVLLADTFGLPELQITLTDAGFEGIPTETAAGWYVVTFTYNGSSPDGGAVDFALMPEGLTIDVLAAHLQAVSGDGEELVEGRPGGAEEGAAAPMASPDAMAGMDMASSPTEDEDPFAWLYETYVAGGPGALPGQTVQGIVDLRPGQYALLDDKFGPAAPATLTVTGDVAADSPVAGAVTADVTVTETGTSTSFDFAVAGTLVAGQQLIEIHNDADQHHFMELIYFPAGITEAQFEALIRYDPSTGAPPAELAGVNLEQIGTGGYVSTQSTGSTQYLAVNLQPGTYVFVCFVPDIPLGGIPHAFQGMYEIVTVS